MPGRPPLGRATLRDTFATILSVFIPTVAKGVIIRRPTTLAIADWLDLDRRAIRTLQRLWAEYGSGPLMLRIPVRSLAVILDPQDVHRVLAESPDPFAPATPAKVAALADFEPKMALISSGPERADRRRYNELVLEADCAVHRLAGHFLEVVESEAGHCEADCDTTPKISYQVIFRRHGFGSCVA